MINVRFEAVNGSLILDVKGHAAFAELGRDPVCAGASVLAMTAAQCVRDMETQKQLRKKPTIRIRNGHVHVVCTPKKAFYGAALHLYYIAETGMHLLAESYPQNVELIPFTFPEDGT